MIPTNALYQGKKESAAGRRYRTNIQPQSGSSFSGGQTITINIPTRANTLLIPSESTLNFSVALTTGAAVTGIRWESCGAHGMIQRIRVYHGSNLLEDIDNYNMLAKVLYDYTAPEDMIRGKGSMLQGTRNDYIAAATGAIAAATTMAVTPVNSGALVVPTGAINNTTGPISFYSLNLVSLLGTLSATKYLPLFSATATPIRLEIQLVANANQGLVSIGGLITSFAVANVEYVGEFLELSDSAIATIMAGAQSPLQYVLPSFRNYVNTQAVANGTQASLAIPAKFSSLKSLFTTIRKSPNVSGVATKWPLSSVSNGLTEFTHRIGSQVVPSKAPQTGPEFAAEAMKCFASLSDLNHQPSIDVAAFSLLANQTEVVLGGASVTQSADFIVGLDCEVYASADKNAYFAGLNTNTDDIYLNLRFAGYEANYKSANAGKQADGATDIDVDTYRFDTFAMYDQVLVAENGVMYVRF